MSAPRTPNGPTPGSFHDAEEERDIDDDAFLQDGRERIVETSRHEVVRDEGDYCEVREVIITKRIIVRKIHRQPVRMDENADAEAGQLQRGGETRERGGGRDEVSLVSESSASHTAGAVQEQQEKRQFHGGVRTITAAPDCREVGGSSSTADKQRMGGIKHVLANGFYACRKVGSEYLLRAFYTSM